MIAKAVSWFLAYVLPCLILLGGLAGLWHSTGYLVDAYRSTSWPRTAGMVIRSELGSESGSVRRVDSTRYWPKIEYEYHVDGQAYQSSNVTLDGLRSSVHVGTGKAEADAVLAQYPLDAKVFVHYDPDFPGRAVLQAGVSGRNFLVPIFSLVLSGIGTWWLRFTLFSSAGGSGDSDRWRGKERECPNCQTVFTSVQDKGVCPTCHQQFYASKVSNSARDTN